MATQGYIFATIHNDSAHNAVLPVREVFYGDCAGSAVVQADWAYVFDCLMCRQMAALAKMFDSFPHGISIGGYATRAFSSCVWEYMQAAADRFIDKTFIPSDGAGRWVRPTYQPVTPNIVTPPRRPRSLDTMRRLFYDCKMMTRWRCQYSHDFKSPSGAWSALPPYWSRNAPLDPVYYDPTDNRRDTAALTDGFRDLVRNSSAWSITPVYAVVEFDATKLTSAGVQHAYKHIVKTMDGNGKIDPNGWTSHDCESFANSQGMDRCEANVAGEYYDVTLPHDSELVPWQWEPTS